MPKEILEKEFLELAEAYGVNDTEDLKAFHIDARTEKEKRKNFTKLEEQPKILIVTEKLLTGFDAPILYAMYLDKPMRDHTLLQAIARVNRPYENEQKGMVKPLFNSQMFLIFLQGTLFVFDFTPNILRVRALT